MPGALTFPHGVQTSGPWDPWEASDQRKKFLVYQHGGGRVQNAGPWDPWLPGVENSRLFAQCAQGTVHPPSMAVGTSGCTYMFAC